MVTNIKDEGEFVILH